MSFNESKRKKKLSFINQDFFSNLPKDTLNEIFDPLLNKDYKIKEEIKCNTKNYRANQFLSNYINEKIQSFNLPTLKQYEQHNIYNLNEDFYNLPTITCKNLCKKESKECLGEMISNGNNKYILHFIPFIPGIEWNEYSNTLKNRILNYIPNENNFKITNGLNDFATITSNGMLRVNDFINLYKIIWKCECLNIQLPFYYSTINGTLFTQRFYNKKQGNWLLIELLYKVITFYTNNITIEEAEELIYHFTKEYNINNDLFIDKMYDLFDFEEEIDINDLFNSEFLIQFKRYQLLKGFKRSFNFNTIELVFINNQDNNENIKSSFIIH